MTIIINCGCPVNGGGADYQEKRYGKGMRVANSTARADGTEYRCTCCGKTTSVSKEAAKANK